MTETAKQLKCSVCGFPLNPRMKDAAEQTEGWYIDSYTKKPVHFCRAFCAGVLREEVRRLKRDARRRLDQAADCIDSAYTEGWDDLYRRIKPDIEADSEHDQDWARSRARQTTEMIRQLAERQLAERTGDEP